MEQQQGRPKKRHRHATTISGGGGTSTRQSFQFNLLCGFYLVTMALTLLLTTIAQPSALVMAEDNTGPYYGDGQRRERHLQQQQQQQHQQQRRRADNRNYDASSSRRTSAVEIEPDGTIGQGTSASSFSWVNQQMQLQQLKQQLFLDKKKDRPSTTNLLYRDRNLKGRQRTRSRNGKGKGTSTGASVSDDDNSQSDADESTMTGGKGGKGNSVSDDVPENEEEDELMTGKGGKGSSISGTSVSEDNPNDEEEDELMTGKGGKGSSSSGTSVSEEDPVEEDEPTMGKGGKGSSSQTSVSEDNSEEDDDEPTTGKGGKGSSSRTSVSEDDSEEEPVLIQITGRPTAPGAPTPAPGPLCIDFECGEGFELRPNPELRFGDDRATCCIRQGVCSGLPVGSPCALGDIDETLIPNPSFEDFTSCPTTFSQLFRAVTWVQATGATSDYMVGAPTCDDSWFRDGIISQIGEIPQQATDGDAFVGSIKQVPGRDYYEYIGACLLSPLIAGNVYTFTLDIAAATDKFMFGGDTNGATELLCIPSCDEFEISGSGYMGTRFPILATAIPGSTLEGGGDWQTITFEATPSEDCPAIMFGPGIDQTIQDGQQGSYVIYDFLNLQAGAAGICNEAGECVESEASASSQTSHSGNVDRPTGESLRPNNGPVIDPCAGNEVPGCAGPLVNMTSTSSTVPPPVPASISRNPPPVPTTYSGSLSGGFPYGFRTYVSPGSGSDDSSPSRKVDQRRRAPKRKV